MTMTHTPEAAPMREDVVQAKDGSDADLVATLERLIMLTPRRANASDAQDLHCSVRAIAESAIERHRLASARPDAGDDVEQWCRILAKADGLDWDHPCPYETESVEDVGDTACENDSCVAAHYEDHDPDLARSRYRRQARAVAALAALAIPQVQS